jgi:hypothetical protein
VARARPVLPPELELVARVAHGNQHDVRTLAGRQQDLSRRVAEIDLHLAEIRSIGDRHLGADRHAASTRTASRSPALAAHPVERVVGNAEPPEAGDGGVEDPESDRLAACDLEHRILAPVHEEMIALRAVHHDHRVVDLDGPWVARRLRYIGEDNQPLVGREDAVANERRLVRILDDERCVEPVEHALRAAHVRVVPEEPGTRDDEVVVETTRTSGKPTQRPRPRPDPRRRALPEEVQQAPNHLPKAGPERVVFFST